MEKKFIFYYSSQFNHSILGITPKAFNAIHMILASHKFILMMMHSVMGIAVGHQSIMGFPSVGVNVALFQDVPP